MHKIILAILMLFTNIAFANDIDVVADIHDVTVKAGETAKIQSLHNIHIINSTGHREKYHFTFCLEISGKRECQYETFTVDNGKKETRYRDIAKYFIPGEEMAGSYNIKSLTSVNGIMRESDATLKVIK